MKVEVDKDLCTGHARCAVAGPRFYTLDEDGFNSLVGAGEVDVPPELEDEARAGCRACPEEAIRLKDASPGTS